MSYFPQSYYFCGILPNLFFLILRLVLDLVEALAIYADDGTLAHEGMGVDFLYQAEDGLRLALLGKHEKHFYFLAGIETGGIHDGYATVGIRVDALAYLLVLLGDDEELHGTATAVHYLVDAERLHVEHHVAVKYFLPVVYDKIAGGNDEDVAYHDDTTQGDVTILVDDGCHDVGSARAATCRESQSDTASAEHGTEEGCPEGLGLEQVDVACLLGDEGGDGGHYDDGVDGLHAELLAQDYPGGDEQAAVDDGVRHLHWASRSPIDDGGDTWQTAGGDVGREEEHVPADGIGYHADGNEHIVLYFTIQGSLCEICCHFSLIFILPLWCEIVYLFAVIYQNFFCSSDHSKPWLAIFSSNSLRSTLKW